MSVSAEKKENSALDTPISRYLTNAPPAWAGNHRPAFAEPHVGLPDYESLKLLDFRQDYSRRSSSSRSLRGWRVGDVGPGSNWNHRQHRLCPARYHHAPDYRAFLWRAPCRNGFSSRSMTSTRVINETNIIPAPGIGLRAGRGPTDESVLGGPEPEHDHRRQFAVFTVLDSARSGCGGCAVSRSQGSRMRAKCGRRQIWPRRRDVAHAGRCRLYGCGWFLDTVIGRPVVEHRGTWQGFPQFIARYMEDGLTVVVLCNLSEGPDPTSHRAWSSRRQPLHAEGPCRLRS